ncbi:MAG TPA: hypothetical protein VKE94_01785, partial [Gemmataceae bacterium]|nr:hypothetical protein [Gemmataceae bacterium]
RRELPLSKLFRKEFPHENDLHLVIRHHDDEYLARLRRLPIVSPSALKPARDGRFRTGQLCA